MVWARPARQPRLDILPGGHARPAAQRSRPDRAWSGTVGVNVCACGWAQSSSPADDVHHPQRLPGSGLETRRQAIPKLAQRVLVLRYAVDQIVDPASIGRFGNPGQGRRQGRQRLAQAGGRVGKQMRFAVAMHEHGSPIVGQGPLAGRSAVRGGPQLFAFRPQGHPVESRFSGRGARLCHHGFSFVRPHRVPQPPIREELLQHIGQPVEAAPKGIGQRLQGRTCQVRRRTLNQQLVLELVLAAIVVEQPAVGEVEARPKTVPRRCQPIPSTPGTCRWVSRGMYLSTD